MENKDMELKKIKLLVDENQSITVDDKNKSEFSEKIAVLVYFDDDVTCKYLYNKINDIKDSLLIYFYICQDKINSEKIINKPSILIFKDGVYVKQILFNNKKNQYCVIKEIIDDRNINDNYNSDSNSDNSDSDSDDSYDSDKNKEDDDNKEEY